MMIGVLVQLYERKQDLEVNIVQNIKKITLCLAM